MRILGFFLSASLAVTGCSSDKEYIRGAHDPSIDNPAMSTGLDKDDVQRALNKLLNRMRTAPIMDTWRQGRGQTNVAIAPFQNHTTEHIDPQLDALLSETENWLVQSGVVTVIARDRQLEAIRTIEGSQHPVFDPRKVPAYGKQMGVQYFITGKVQAADERTSDSRRVQYWVFLQVIDVETSAIRFSEKEEITKMVR
jgi:hypothetical protein